VATGRVRVSGWDLRIIFEIIIIMMMRVRVVLSVLESACDNYCVCESARVVSGWAQGVLKR
jgi:hypothetical protein